MNWGRSELEALGREELLAHARRIGIARPELMTRLELVEELLRAGSADDNERRMARSLLGKARDLVARVMDLGLHLPDAAQRIRPAAQPQGEPHAPEPLATVALAAVYAAQGHRQQALRVVERVLDREPSHPEALRLKQTLSNESTQEPCPEPAPAPTPAHAAPMPASTPASDELRVELRDGLARLSWRVMPSSFARRRAVSPEARLVLRLVSVRAGMPEPLVTTVDTEIDSFAGARDVPFQGSRDTVCAAVGVRSGDRFDVIATGD